MERFLKGIIAVALLVVLGSLGFMGYKIMAGDSGAPLMPLTHRSVVDAMAELEKMGLKARIETERSSFPEGTVISQSPQPGVKVRSDTIVTLKVSGGTSRVQLPDLRGLLVDEAVRQLSAAGFRVGDQIHVTSDKPAGTVIAQEPAAPGSVPLTQPISLMVSTGASSGGGVVVPDMVQRPYDEAVNLLQSSGLKAGRQEEYAPNTPEGMVLAMSPRAGSSVPSGARVTLTVASHNGQLAVEEQAPAADQPAATPSDGNSDGSEPAPATDPSAGAAAQTAEGAAQASAAVPTLDVKPAAEQPAESGPTAAEQTSASKTARIRYQVPPVSGMTVKVEMTDAKGTRTLVERQAKSGELLKVDAPYEGSAMVTIYLGGEFVWQDRYQ